MPRYPSVFARTMTASSSPVTDFGFEAETVWIRNDATRSVYFNFGSTAVASTAATMLEVKSSETFGPITLGRIGGFSAHATEAATFRILARGW